VQRPKGDLVAHGGVEELSVGALKDHADAAAEALRRRFVSEGAVVDALAEGFDGALCRLGETGQDLQQRGLAGAVGAENGEALTAVDRQIDRGERLDPGAYSKPTPARRNRAVARSGVSPGCVVSRSGAASSRSPPSPGVPGSGATDGPAISEPPR
jgi:hypothetical protein